MYCIVPSGDCIGSLRQASQPDKQFCFEKNAKTPTTTTTTTTTRPIIVPSNTHLHQRYGHAETRLTPYKYLFTGGEVLWNLFGEA